MRSAAASALVALAFVAAGCGGSDDETTDSPSPPPPPPPATTSTEPEPIVVTTGVGVYFVRDDKLGFAERTIEATPPIPQATLEELLAGPTAEETEAGLTSDVPPNTTIVSLDLVDGTAAVELSNPLDQLGTMQVVQTLTQLDTIERVRLEGREYASTDTEDALPAILVESPAPGATVTSPLTISGTANTFEATFMVELRPEQGKPLYKDFVTATSGNGTRGTFEKSLDFTVDRERPGMLVVYENSAEDGSVVNEVEIPVTIRP